MAGPNISGKITLDESQAAAALEKIRKVGTASAAKLGSEFKEKFGSLTSPIAALGPAIAAAFTSHAIVTGVKNVFDAAEALGDLSDQTGVSVGRLAVLGKAFENAGLASEDAGSAINRMQKFLGEFAESGAGADVFTKLHLDASKLQNLRPEQQFIVMGKAISGLPTATERARTAMELFGKSGGRLLAVFTDPAFLAAGGPLTGKAAVLERNAEAFAQASIKLHKAGGVLKGFYVGVAAEVVKPLTSVLNRLEKINLVGLGQKFGEQLKTGSEIGIGMFKHPELVAGAVGAALDTAFAKGGNTLQNVMSAGVSFFENGMADAFEGIGDVAISVLMDAFAKPIAFLQAQLENALDYLNSPTRQLKGMVGRLQEEQRNDLALAAKQKPGSGAKGEPMFGVFGGPLESLEDAEGYKATTARMAERKKRIADTLKKLEEVRANEDKSLSESVDERYNRIRKEGVRFGLVDGGMTSKEYLQQAAARLEAARAAAQAAYRDNAGRDTFGAAEAEARLKQYMKFFQASGAKTLGGGLPEETKAAVAAALGGTGFFRMSPAWQQAYRNAHTVGNLGTLDDPTMGPGWRGAPDFRVGMSKEDWQNYYGNSGGVFKNSTSLTTGGLGGGAYGRTGNIWSQLSGRVTSQDSAAATAKNTAEAAAGIKTLVQNLTGGSGASAGGGATAAG